MNITILGLGLIGGSLGMALRNAPRRFQVTGWDRSADVVATALERGAVDAGGESAAEAVRCADVVVIATPVMAIRGVLASIAPALKPGAIVSDVASTKAQVSAWARAILPAHATFVGGHPMAGSERQGILHARPGLFVDAVYCITAATAIPAAAVAVVEELARAVGARPMVVDAERHDEYVAAVSHLPFMLSTALVRRTTLDARWAEMRRIAATGYRDISRLASGDTAMHRDICLSNAPAIRRELRAMARLLDEVADQLDDPAALDAFFGDAQREREAWLREREQRAS